MTKTLNTIPLNTEMKITAFTDDFLREKLTEMGCLIGDKVTLLRRAPLGDPLFIQIGYSQIGLRVSEAKAIEVE